MKISRTGYKKNSKDRNEPGLIIPSGRITMKSVQFPVLGVDNRGNAILMQPGGEYQFPGQSVFETPMKQVGGQPAVNDDIRTKWNRYVDYLEQKGLKGSSALDKNGLGLTVLDQYAKEVPDAGLTRDSILPIQNEFQKYRDWSLGLVKQGKAQLAPGATEDSYMKDLSTTDGYPGQRTTSFKFPTSYLQAGNISTATGYSTIKQMGGGLQKYFKKCVACDKSPQGQSIDEFLKEKNDSFLNFLSTNTQRVLLQDEVTKARTFLQEGGGVLEKLGDAASGIGEGIKDAGSDLFGGEGIDAGGMDTTRNMAGGDPSLSMFERVPGGMQTEGSISRGDNHTSTLGSEMSNVMKSGIARYGGRYPRMQFGGWTNDLHSEVNCTDPTTGETDPDCIFKHWSGGDQEPEIPFAPGGGGGIPSFRHGGNYKMQYAGQTPPYGQPAWATAPIPSFPAPPSVSQSHSNVFGNAPENPMGQGIQTSGNFGQGQFGAYSDQPIPEGVQAGKKALENPADKSGKNKGKGKFVKALNFGYDAIGISNTLMGDQIQRDKSLWNSSQMRISNQIAPNYGTKGDYDTNSGVFQPQNMNPMRYQKGGSMTREQWEQADAYDQKRVDEQMDSLGGYYAGKPQPDFYSDIVRGLGSDMLYGAMGAEGKSPKYQEGYLSALTEYKAHPNLSNKKVMELGKKMSKSELEDDINFRALSKYDKNRVRKAALREFKKGGSYNVSHSEIGDLLRQGYQFEILD